MCARDAHVVVCILQGYKQELKDTVRENEALRHSMEKLKDHVQISRWVDSSLGDPGAGGGERGGNPPLPPSFILSPQFPIRPWISSACVDSRREVISRRDASVEPGLHVRRKHKHKRQHKPRVNRDDASTSERKRNARLCWYLRRPGSHVACAYACVCVVRVNQP